MALAWERTFPDQVRAEDMPMKDHTRAALKALRGAIATSAKSAA